MKYRILAPVTFAAGATLGLTAAQSNARRYGLKALGRGLHQATVPVQFKAGEELTVHGDLPKSLVAAMQAVAPGRGAGKAAD